MTQQNVYDGTSWLVSLFRSTKEYVENFIDNYVLDGVDPVGLEAYRLVMDFPEAAVPAELFPAKTEGKPVTLIHMAVDEIVNEPLGLGDGTYAESFVEGDVLNVGKVYPEEAEIHTVNFDIGVWASDQSGGSTSRLVAYQMLTDIFSGPSAEENFQTATGGVEIRSFTGGRFLIESVNDIRMYRVIGCELIVRVFSRKVVVPSSLTEEVDQTPGLVIGDEIIVNWQ